MNFLIQAGASLAAAIVLAACGGGDGLPSAQAAVLPAPDASAAGAARVSIEGCVDGAPGRSVAVQATGRDGRLLGDALADAAGRFRLELPRGVDATLAAQGEPDGALTVRVGARSFVIAGCLRAST